MNDRSLSDKPEFLSFTVAEAVIVSIGYDNRCTSLPAWLSTWDKAGTMIRTTTDSCHLVVYRKAFPPGTITIGGCKAPGVAAMYTVAITPADTP